MNPLQLWQWKVLQTLHDPVTKIALQKLPGFAHEGVARRHVQAFTGLTDPRLPFKAPDWLASGADRPVLGGSKTVDVDWRADRVLTHPLQPGLTLRIEDDALPAGRGATVKAEALDEVVRKEIQRLGITADEWERKEPVRRAFLRLWRNLPELYRACGVQAPYLPADSRCPDHSLWDHTRVASAAAYLVEHDRKERPPEREPWMLAVTLRGVQAFVESTRTGRDLWTASMIYADLAWAALLPIVEEHGPDSVLYPDLRGNPVVDRWLLSRDDRAVPEAVRRTGAVTYAAMLPNTFVALVPGDRARVADLATKCTEAVHHRWLALADAVESWLGDRVPEGPWRRIWKRQVADGWRPPVTWAAAPWERRMHDLKGRPAVRGPALPGRPPGTAPTPLPKELQDREQALSPWIPARIWTHYEHARDVYWHADGESGTNYLVNERGFDYPLVHHQVRAALALRKEADGVRPLSEPGEKCTVTGWQEALHNGEGGGEHLVTRRRAGARRFWQNRRLDPDGGGAERLGSQAAIKRFLVPAGERRFTDTWWASADGAGADDDGPRVPFPSTAAITAAAWLEEVARGVSASPELRGAVDAFVDAFDRGPLKETVDPRALPALARAARAPGMERLLKIEAGYLYPDALEPLCRRAEEGGKTGEAAALKALWDAAVELRRAGTKVGLGVPGRLVAVLRMDGDALGRQILGDPEVVRTRWRDVLHPRAVEQAERKLASTGWPGLLEARRHVGPAVHAAISRSLADFSHRMVAWVIEREFGGRIVYTGGDDLLALLPAGEAICAAARLQQLLSAPYVVDTAPGADPWGWRRAEGDTHPERSRARERFRVPVPDQGGEIRLSRLVWEDHAAGDTTPPELPRDRGAALYPMLGRGHSLSAGIAIGHYKTPLSTLLSTARSLLDDEAKERLGRGAVVAALLSRGGSKVVFAAKWAPTDLARPEVQGSVDRVRAAFAGGRLPGRLPYKLREQLAILGEPAYGEVREDHGADVPRVDLERLVRLAADGALSGDSRDVADRRRDVVALLRAGLRYADGIRKEDEDTGARAPRDLGQYAVGGLLLARGLAGDGGDDGAA